VSEKDSPSFRCERQLTMAESSIEHSSYLVKNREGVTLIVCLKNSLEGVPFLYTEKLERPGMLCRTIILMSTSTLAPSNIFSSQVFL